VSPSDRRRLLARIASLKNSHVAAILNRLAAATRGAAIAFEKMPPVVEVNAWLIDQPLTHRRAIEGVVPADWKRDVPIEERPQVGELGVQQRQVRCVDGVGAAMMHLCLREPGEDRQWRLRWHGGGEDAITGAFAQAQRNRALQYGEGE
jgi:hypothetical protein